jgi:hypothetical protein
MFLANAKPFDTEHTKNTKDTESTEKREKRELLMGPPGCVDAKAKPDGLKSLHENCKIRAAAAEAALSLQVLCRG